MYRRLSEPLPLSEASLVALRPALNAPVLNAGFMPVGPARAAIVVFGEEWGGLGIALGIRSNESGQVAVFRNQEQIEPDVPVATALEPLLAEAERLGFVFDEDMVAGDETVGRSRAMGLWGRLMGDIDMPPAPKAVPAEPAATESILPPAKQLMDPEQEAEAAALATAAPEEFLLEDVAEAPPAPVELTLDTPAPDEMLVRPPAPEPPREIALDAVVAKPGPEVSQPTEPMVAVPPEPAPAKPRASKRAKAAPAEAPQQKLSKFRAADEAVANEEVDTAPASPAPDTTAGKQNALGRIPIVRVRKGRDGARRVPYLARLLSSF